MRETYGPISLIGLIGCAIMTLISGRAAADNLYVSNYNNQTIERFAQDGTNSVFASNPAGQFFLDNPTGIAFDRNGNLYVANNGIGVIEEFTPGGNASTFANIGLATNPFGLACEEAGSLYVAMKITSSGDSCSPLLDYRARWLGF